LRARKLSALSHFRFNLRKNLIKFLILWFCYNRLLYFVLFLHLCIIKNCFLYLCVSLHFRIHVSQSLLRYKGGIFKRKQSYCSIFSFASGISTWNIFVTFDVSTCLRKTLPAPSLNVVTKNLILTAMQFSKTY